MDITDIPAGWAIVIAAVFAALGGFTGHWLTSRGTRENALIDQLQEELGRARSEEREKINGLEVGARGLNRRMRRLETRELQWRQYTFDLQQHINEGKPPPPPPFPPGLLGIETSSPDEGDD